MEIVTQEVPLCQVCNHNHHPTQKCPICGHLGGVKVHRGPASSTLHFKTTRYPGKLTGRKGRTFTKNYIIVKVSKKLKSVKGRLELVKEYPNQTKVFIDFAHTPEAIKTAINSLKMHFNKDITIVFGCGGDRDKAKRPLMGQVALEGADRIVVTNDNPRAESPEKIATEIETGWSGRGQGKDMKGI